MKALKRINLFLFGFILLILSGCGEYIPDTVVYTEVPTTYIVYEYSNYRPVRVYRHRYYNYNHRYHNYNHRYVRPIPHNNRRR